MDADHAFDAFIADARPRLARAFVAAFGADRGEDALAEALGYAWEHFAALAAMGNPVGYLYRVGESRTRSRRRRAVLPMPVTIGLPAIEPALVGALRGLSERQRVCVVLASGFQWSHQEIADLLGLSRSSVQNHVERAMQHLRNAIGVTNDV